MTSEVATRLQISTDGDERSTERLGIATANVCLLRLLERIAIEFNKAKVPLMALKGAALNLTVVDQPDERPMSDLDLMIRPKDVDKAVELLEAAGCLRGEPLVREDFFPRYHYEMDFVAGHIFQMRIDLHARPLRPMCYARRIPSDAFWRRAVKVRVGKAMVYIPSAKDMLVHLAAHSAVHGNPRRMWLEDLKRWVDAHGQAISWRRFIATLKAWRLVLPVREALLAAEKEFGPICPPRVRRRLSKMSVGWLDKLALWQAPRDFNHPVSHVLVDFLCTPGIAFKFSYLLAVLFPDRRHMEDWYFRRHYGWLPLAHVLRLLGPVIRHFPSVRSWISKIDTRRSALHGIGVFATRNLREGELIARYHGKPCDHAGMYVVEHRDGDGTVKRYELTGKLKYLNHCCRPTARLEGFELRAVRPIEEGKEVTIDYGKTACDCRQVEEEIPELACSA